MVLLVAAAALAMIPPLWQLGLPLERPDEGWNATHALHAFNGDLYPPRGSFIVNNYTPMWFYLTGLLDRLFGDPIIPGRVLALLGFALTGIAILFLLRRLGCKPGAAVVGAASYVATMAGLFGDWVGLAEPQILAQGLAAAGAAVLVGARERKVAIAAAVLMVLGGLTKQTVIALPLASALWLLAYRRALFPTWFIAGGLLTAAALGALLAGYGDAFVANIAFPRVLSLDRLGTNLALTSKLAVPLVAFAALAWPARRRLDAAMAFGALSIAAALVTILALGSAEGVSTNIAFDLVIASSIGFGLVWDCAAGIGERRKTDLLRLALVGAFLVRIGLGLSAHQIAFFVDPAERQRILLLSATTARLRDRLSEVEDPVACETLSQCAWAHHPSTVDLWKLRHERTLSPPMDERLLLAQIADGHFGAVVTFGRFAGPQDDGNIPGLSVALARGYSPPVYFGSVATLFVRRSPGGD